MDLCGSSLFRVSPNSRQPPDEPFLNWPGPLYLSLTNTTLSAVPSGCSGVTCPNTELPARKELGLASNSGISSRVSSLTVSYLYNLIPIPPPPLYLSASNFSISSIFNTLHYAERTDSSTSTASSLSQGDSRPRHESSTSRPLHSESLTTLNPTKQLLPLHHLPPRNPQQNLHLLSRIRGYRRKPEPIHIYTNVPSLPPKRLLLPTGLHPTHTNRHLPPPNLPTNLHRSLPSAPPHQQAHILVLPGSPRNHHLILSIALFQQNEPRTA